MDEPFNPPLYIHRYIYASEHMLVMHLHQRRHRFARVLC